MADMLSLQAVLNAVFDRTTNKLRITVSGAGNVTGPASSTDNAIARWDGVTGQLLQNSVVLVGDTGAVSGATGLYDANLNELLLFTTAATSINYINLSNAVASQNPTFAAQGDDTTIGIQFNVKGLAYFGINGDIVIQQSNWNTGTPTGFILAGGTHTTLTAGVEAIDFNLNFAHTVQFNTGAIATERTMVIQGPTYAFVAASIITTAVTLDVQQPTAGTNATISNNFAIRSNGSINLSGGTNSSIVATAADQGITIIGNRTSGSSGQVIVRSTNNVNPGVNLLVVQESSNIRFQVQSSGNVVQTMVAESSGTISAFVITNANHTSQTLSTEVINFSLSAYTRSWATGALATQREVALGQVTYAATGASVFTTVVGLEMYAPSAGTNVTITNLYGLNLGADTTIGATAAGSTYRALRIPAHTLTVAGTTQVTSTCAVAAVALNIITITDASAVTIDAAATLYIAGAPLAAGSVSLTSPYSIWIDAGSTRLDGRVLMAQGADVAAANDLSLGNDGNTFEITGATQINAITTTGWTLGTLITLIFASTPTVKHNNAGGANTAVLLLAGAADFSATAGDTLTLRYSEQGGTNAWREVARAVI